MDCSKPRIVRMLIANIPLREPWPSEAEFFRSNPNVTGMATDDGTVVLNPFSTLSERQLECVALNEAARVFIRIHGPRPNFELTDEQIELFSGYGSQQDIRETIAARLLSGDPSATNPTSSQLAFVASLKIAMVGEAAE